MNTSFAHFCVASPAALDILRRSIDTWDSLGKSYEFPDCLMPPGCTPPSAALGFARRGNGYLLYWKPAVAYSGDNPALASLFSRSVWTFPDFAALSGRLSALQQEMQAVSAPKILRASPGPLTMERKKPLFSRRDASGVWPPLYLQLLETLGKTVLGQPQALRAAAYRLYAHVGKTAPARPLSLILHGPTGTGKSELGKAIAPALSACCGQPYQFVWTDLNTFTQPHSVHRLTGAPPGYVGYEDAPVFEAVRRSPRTVFMFDELEKAHPEVLKVFMSILDEGRCTARRPDSTGSRELDFRRCVLVFTTNAPLSGPPQRRLGFSSAPPEEPEAPVPDTPPASPEALAAQLFQENEEARRALIRLDVLPEIAGRFTALIGFRPLDHAARLAVTAKQIAALGREYGLRLQADPDTVSALAPAEDAVSIRSAASVLEGLLTPLLIQAAASGRTSFRLSGRPGALRLTPAYCSAS
ncbi:MAG: ATP-dependent Clp protease ATP-binding subunit [Oscillibacter sp.]|nr:ATP-dependent Clp protease ATP-binding subunit [Oscillibacter sp.]